MPVYGPDILDEIRSRLSLVDYVGKTVKLTRKGRDFWGCCPFHREKTASFTVSDDKGFYHCFGCGAHGDIFTFEQETNHLSFVDAVKRLAQTAGVRLPERIPEDTAQEKRRRALFDALEQACAFFQNALTAPEGTQALMYLQKRGLTESTIKKFRLGYAPAGNALKRYFEEKGVAADILQTAGLLHFSDKRNEFYDYFRDRVMFPIQDAKNRVIAFGGRVIGQGEPKYLNSPDSPVFSKGAQLYALNHAIDVARKERRLVGVEGYMDAISLHAAGVGCAVAPLGTALTEKQIEIMWKTAPEPVLCFDNDVAGHNAAFRAAERVLPMLKAGFSLSFMFTPDGYKDPDEFVKAQGRSGFEKILNEQKIPLYRYLWNRLTRENPSDTPERFAFLEKTLLETAGRIKDPAVQNYYRREWKNALWELSRSRPKREKGRFYGKNDGDRRFSPAVAKISYPSLTPEKENDRMTTAYVLTYPDIVSGFLEDLSFFVPKTALLNDVVRVCETLMAENPDATRDDVRLFLEQNGKGAVFSFLADELEMLAKKNAYPQEIGNEISRRLSYFRELSGQREKDDLLARMADAPADEQQKLWEEYLLLQNDDTPTV